MLTRRRTRRWWTALTVLATALGLLTLVPAPPAAAAAGDVPAAIQRGVDNAAQYGVTQYVVVLDRHTGQLLGSTSNADAQVASESLMKMFLAAYYLRAYGGVLPAQMNSDLWYMIQVSDDDIATRYWTANAVPTIAAVYGMPNTINNPSRPGYWGATHITARDVATFLWRASQDPLVGGWLFGAMQNATDYGSDGYNQNFGFNAAAGAGSKQGWGCDSFWVGPCAIHSVGFTDTVIGAVLQTGSSSTTGVMRDTATATVNSILDAASTPAYTLPGRDNPEGWFGVSLQGTTAVLDGYAFDGSDLLWNVPVGFSVNGVPTVYTSAAQSSPELWPYGIPGQHHFTTSYALPNTGTYEFCMFLGNVRAGSSQLVQCSNLSVPADAARDNPGGGVSASVNYDGVISVGGYAYDPSNLYAPLGTWVADNGQLAGTPVANAAQPSLAPYGIPGAHGVRYAYQAPSTGSHNVCLYAVNIGWGANSWVACTPVNFPADHDRDDPHGDFTVSATSGGAVVSGWSFDKNNLYATTVSMFTVDGNPVLYRYANEPSPSLGQYGVPGNHGVTNLVPAGRGTHTICMFTYNIGYGSNQLNKCAAVTV